jgi:hypothetical protein
MIVTSADIRAKMAVGRRTFTWEEEDYHTAYKQVERALGAPLLMFPIIICAEKYGHNSYKRRKGLLEKALCAQVKGWDASRYGIVGYIAMKEDDVQFTIVDNGMSGAVTGFLWWLFMSLVTFGTYDVYHN